MAAKILMTILVIAVSINCISQKKNQVNYLNQKLPGMTAGLFAPGIVSTGLSEHSTPAFSPDGSIVLWTVMDKTYRGYLLEMKYKNGSWSKPVRPSFADTTADDFYASFSPDGKKLFFSSRRKVPAGYPEGRDIRIWEVVKNSDGWGKPMPFDTTVSQGQDYAHSIAKNGTLYFSSALGGETNMNIRKSEKINGRNIKPVLLPYSINSVDYEDGPYIAPDESFLIFESQRPEGIEGSLDLYISFKNKNGRWGMPVNMGSKINSGSSERFARLSPDGKFLFFGSSRNMSADNWGFDIYWIEAKVIDELRNDEAAKTIIEQPLGDEVINALYKNDVEGAAVSLKKWHSLYPNSLDATVIYSSNLRKQKRYAEAEQLLANKAGQWDKNANIIMEKALSKFGLNKEEEAVKLLSPLMKGEAQTERYKYISNALLEMGKFKASDDYFQNAMAINANGYEYLRRASKFISINEKDRAFETLNKALAFDYLTKNDFENDAGLAPLKSDARWKLLVEKLK